MSDPFWANVDESLDTIENEQPDNAQSVVALLNEYCDTSAGDAFFPGSGGNRSLLESLEKAGWDMVWSEASYFYVVRHESTGDYLTYIEGDIYVGNRSE